MRMLVTTPKRRVDKVQGRRLGGLRGIVKSMDEEFDGPLDDFDKYAAESVASRERAPSTKLHKSRSGRSVNAGKGNSAMEALRFRTKLMSNTIRMPQLSLLRGRDVEVIVLADGDPPTRKASIKFGNRRILELAGKIDLDWDAVSDLRKLSMI